MQLSFRLVFSGIDMNMRILLALLWHSEVAQNVPLLLIPQRYFVSKVVYTEPQPNGHTMIFLPS